METCEVILICAGLGCGRSKKLLVVSHTVFADPLLRLGRARRLHWRDWSMAAHRAPLPHPHPRPKPAFRLEDIERMTRPTALEISEFYTMFVQFFLLPLIKSCFSTCRLGTVAMWWQSSDARRPELGWLFISGASRSILPYGASPATWRSHQGLRYKVTTPGIETRKILLVQNRLACRKCHYSPILIESLF